MLAFLNIREITLKLLVNDISEGFLFQIRAAAPQKGTSKLNRLRFILITNGSCICMICIVVRGNRTNLISCLFFVDCLGWARDDCEQYKEMVK